MDHSPPGSSVIPSSRSLTLHPTTSRPLVTTYLISFSIRFFGVLCCSIWGVCVCVFNINRFHYKWDHTIFVSVWLSSLSMIPSRSVCVVANGRISFFYDLMSIVLFYGLLSQVHHSFLIHSSDDRHRFFPCFSYCKSRCSHWTRECRRLFRMLISFPSDTYTQKWDCWITW